MILRASRGDLADTVAFHAQQCAEKYLKALLVHRDIDFPRMHDIERLLRITDLAGLVAMSVEEQRLLSDYGTVTRYPGDYEPVSLAEARRAVALARQVRKLVRQEIPEVTRRKRRSPPS